MGRPIGPKKVHRYRVEFKLTAVKLSGMPGVQVHGGQRAGYPPLHAVALAERGARRGAEGASQAGRGRAPARAQAAAGARA